jgi:hypothetical protein
MPKTALEERRTDPGTSWLLPPFFMLRLGGLPMDSVAPLRFPDTVAWAERTLAVEREVAAAKGPLADALETAVGALTDNPLRRRVLELRRDVFNGRLPRRSDNEADVVAAVGPTTGPMLASWLEARRRLATLHGEGETVLDAELTARRRGLRELADHPRLRHGLLLASPSLDSNLRTYLNAPDGPLGKRARRIERSVLEYVYRTACKTSPFSTLGAIELGRIRPDGSGFLDVGALDGPWQSHVRLNLAALARIVDLVLSNPDLRNDLPVRVTTGWRQDRDRVRYVRRQRTLGAEDTAVSLDMLHESLFYLTSGRILEQVLEALPDGVELRVGELVDRLHAAGPPGGYARDDLETYVEHLLRLGLLTVPALHVDIHSPDPLADFADRVRGIDRVWATTLSKRLSAVVELVTTYRTWDLDVRRRVLDAVRQELAAAQHDLGREEPSTPQTILYEDVTVGAGVTAGEAQWRADLLPALEGLSRILPVFDMVLPQRLVTQGFFRARFGAGGRCGDVLRFVHEFHQDFYEQFMQASMRRREFDDDGEYLAQPNWLKLPELAALDEARRELVSRMRAAYAAATDPAAELVLDDDFVDGVAALLPHVPGELDPRCFFLQVGADADGAPLAVLNRAYTGLTLLFSRFAHCFPGAGEDGLEPGLRETMVAAQPPGAVFAELKGGYETTNLNLHPAVTPYELVCPGDVSFRAPEEQIPVDDLEIVDDPDIGQVILRSRRLGKQVIPVYLGFLLPMALPEVQRLLLNFSYTAMARLDLWSGTDQPLGDKPIGGHPRVRYRNLVLHRRLWKTAPSRVPQRDQQSDAQWMLDWVRWRREHGLPRRVFVTVDAGGPREEPAEPGAPQPAPRPAAMGTNKPQYVDFDSYFSLCLLDNTVKTAANRVVFTEMLPDQDDLWVGRDGQGYVSELTVEIDGLRGRTA